MLWDKNDISSFDKFKASRQGSFALSVELKLVEYMVSGWPRRGRKLLDIGCGAGFFLKFFHQTGFDVTGLDNSPVMLAAAREELGSCSEFQLANAEHLPFDDKQFDYSVMLFVLEFCEDPGLVLREAVRCSRHGLLILGLNKYSAYYLARTQSYKSKLNLARWYSYCDLRNLIYFNIGHKKISVRSVLPLPFSSWGSKFFGCNFGTSIYKLPIGAVNAVRVDLGRDCLKNPLFALNTEPGLG